VRNPDGEVYMLPADLMRAVVPVFPPSESTAIREGRLSGERNPGELHCAPSEFFMLFDTNNDGLISFAE
jgi:calcium uptake protein 1, mitochondrial